MRVNTEIPSLGLCSWLKEPRLQAVLAVLNTGGETRVVGGAIRNALLGLPISDVDLATTLTPRDVMQLGKGAGFSVHPIGIEHGTVMLVNRAASFEVTTLRRDVSTDGRWAKVAFTTDFATDAARRDFTINALYCSAKGKIYDYTDGYKDILNRRIRFVGDAALRIQEDYLRILRFFRFYAIYGKGRIDASGLAAATSFCAGLDGVSAERKRQELLKLLLAPRAAEVLKIMAEAGILKRIIAHGKAWRVIKRLPPDAILRLYALALEPLRLMETLRLSGAEAARIAQLDAAPDFSLRLSPKQCRVLLYQLGEQTYTDASTLAYARSAAVKDDKTWARLINLPKRWGAPVFPLQGQDLLNKGIAAGPELGHLLNQAKEKWLDGDFRADKTELLSFIESKIHDD